MVLAISYSPNLIYKTAESELRTRTKKGIYSTVGKLYKTN